MEDFTDAHSKSLLSKEWLVKVDNAKSRPYLFKYAISGESSSCCFMITDMKTVWTEVISRKHFYRRWKKLNPNLTKSSREGESSEPSTGSLDFITAMHSVDGVSDISFDISESSDADLDVELECEEVKWRWECYVVGPKRGAAMIMDHLIMPLITVTHLSFYSADPVSELAEDDLEKVVDRVCRGARRSMDTHVKHTISKPRIATTLQRISSIQNQFNEIPAIKSEVAAIDYESRIQSISAGLDDRGASESKPSDAENTHQSKQRQKQRQEDSFVVVVKDTAMRDGSDSATESDEDVVMSGGLLESGIPPPTTSTSTDFRTKGESKLSADDAHEDVVPPAEPEGSKEDDSPPPLKKLKTPPIRSSNSLSRHATDTDSDAEHGSQHSGRMGATRGAARGVRQPLRRGKKRF